MTIRGDALIARDVREARNMVRRDIAETVPVVQGKRRDSSWTDVENDVLRAMYPDYDGLRVKLPHRTRAAIRAQARLLNIQQGYNAWTTSEIKKLKALHHNHTVKELAVAIPSRSEMQIRWKLKKLRLHLRPAKLKPTGHWLCDAIRERARLVNMTMKELDEESGTGSYFKQHNWRRSHGDVNGGHSMKKMLKAVEALGGKLQVVWPDDGECIDTIDVGEP